MGRLVEYITFKKMRGTTLLRGFFLFSQIFARLFFKRKTGGIHLIKKLRGKILPRGFFFCFPKLLQDCLLIGRLVECTALKQSHGTTLPRGFFLFAPVLTTLSFNRMTALTGGIHYKKNCAAQN